MADQTPYDNFDGEKDPEAESDHMVPSAPPIADPAPQQEYKEDEELPQEANGPATNLFEVDMAIISVASLIELTAAGKNCHDQNSCTKQNGYAVAVGVLGFLIAIAYIFVLKRQPETLTSINGIIGSSNAIFWMIAVIVLTFDRPFVETSNGYFSTWIAFFAASHFLFWSVPRVQNFIAQMRQAQFQQWSRKILLIILLASLIEVVAAANVCSIRDMCKNDYAWAVACGTISFAIVGILLLLPRIANRFLHWFASVLFIWWAIGAGVMTYDGPFLTAGNGYFACWVAALASFYLMYFALFGEPEDEGDEGAKSGVVPPGPAGYQDAGENPDFPSAEL
mmetsp:Transcript_14691/g.20568  ORF Transcript_14691/g.20568 Transcript_14691/m.20568 type:complete len:337 (-) Transcript_14691:232-1242(-)|eukprot:CAMPEP_0184479550 /NCGR_PEP_ID=MMETSP0113_2-20130426/1236_1 /TAXON_ID=91329 /ORGANISM="Norrisiella sphaerica, Strain BC52" /LENGTH=336 /DNA_ID=CAMNT_0026857663 /DNA_START=299 /DNA_END=1309 /DNA_ORIENTATION=-